MLQQRLGAAGIGYIDHTIHFPPHIQGAYADLGMAAEAFPLALQMADEVLSLPIGPQMDYSECRACVHCCLCHELTQPVPDNSRGLIRVHGGPLAAHKAVNILISILRMKVLAILLGPTGVGMLSIYNNLQGVATTAAGLGIGDKRRAGDC